MPRLLCILAVFLGSLLPAPAAESPIREGSVVVLPLKGEVTQAQFFFLRRILKQAESEKAAAFIIDLDTYGGSLDAAVKMLNSLMEARIPTITYVNTNAGSAGALIALSTQRIFMAPVSAIGAAAPVSGEGQDLQETMKAKVVSYFSGYFRSAAEKNGYNPELAEAFINKDKEVKIGDTVVNKPGALLTLSSQEATRVLNGRPLLASGIAPSLSGLCVEAGLDPANLVLVEPSGFERLAQWITTLAPLFLLGGILGVYLEMKAPGFGAAGVVAALCFLLFFAGHYIAGLTGFEAAAVFVLGIALIVVELIFFPGVTVLVMCGALLVLGSLLFAMLDYYPTRSFQFSPEHLLLPLANLVLALVLASAAIAFLARYFPQMPLLNRLILGVRQPSGASLGGSISAPETLVKVGDLGVARTILRPSGKAEFAGRLIDVMTEGEFFDPGTPLAVRRVEGERVIVSAQAA